MAPTLPDGRRDAGRRGNARRAPPVAAHHTPATAPARADPGPALMRAFSVEAPGVLHADALPMPVPEDDHVVQALAPDTAQEALGQGVHPRCPVVAAGLKLAHRHN